VIAIIDNRRSTGTHPDLASKMVAGWNIYGKNSDTSDVYGHGNRGGRQPPAAASKQTASASPESAGSA